jgi:general secretion pathway protein D
MDLGVAWPTSSAWRRCRPRGGTGITIRDLRNLNSGTIGVTGVSMAINANKTDTDSNLLANPRIRVRNKEKAKVVIGDKLPNITTTVSSGVGGFASDSVTYVDVGLTLNVEPTIYLNNEVAIRMLAGGQQPDQHHHHQERGTIAYQIGTRSASTMLQLKDGENQVLAGLINSEERGTGNKVPGAGDLPIIGRLFGSQRDDNQKTEIVLSITPHLVRNVQRPEASSSEFSAGTEASFRRRPDLTPRAAAQLPPVPGMQPSALPAVPSPVRPPPLPVQAMPISQGQPAPLPPTQGVQPQPVQPADTPPQPEPQPEPAPPVQQQ